MSDPTQSQQQVPHTQRVTVALDERHEVECCVLPSNGRPRITELTIRPREGYDEVLITAVRQVALRDIADAIERGQEKLKPAITARNRTNEDLLAVVAIAQEEFASAGSESAIADIHAFLSELNEIESADDWPWGDDGKLVGRKYGRSSVRGLWRKARQRGYANLASATATLKLAEERTASWVRLPAAKIAEARSIKTVDAELVKVAELHDRAMRQRGEPIEYIRREFRDQRLREDRRFLSPDEAAGLVHDARQAGILNSEGYYVPHTTGG